MVTQIKSRERVRDLAEVYTRAREVNDMLNLIPQTVYQNPLSRWLEPSCGTGNFMAAILERKMTHAAHYYETGDHAAGDLALIQIVANLYGVDISEENVVETRDRLLNLALNFRAAYIQENTITGSDDTSSILTAHTLEDALTAILNETVIVADTLNPQSYTITGFEFTNGGSDNSTMKETVTATIYPLPYVMKQAENHLQHLSQPTYHYTNLSTLTGDLDALRAAVDAETAPSEQSPAE